MGSDPGNIHFGNHIDRMATGRIVARLDGDTLVKGNNPDVQGRQDTVWLSEIYKSVRVIELTLTDLGPWIKAGVILIPLAMMGIGLYGLFGVL